MEHKATRISEDCILFVSLLEGFKPKAYPCEAGKWTIGYGETEGVREGDVIDQRKAWENLSIKLFRIAEEILSCVTVPLTQRQLDTLASFTYNAGMKAFKTSTLRRLLNLGCYDTVPHEMVKWKWITQDGHKVISKGLFHRRLKEVALWSSDSGQSYRDLANMPIPVE